MANIVFYLTLILIFQYIKFHCIYINAKKLCWSHNVRLNSEAAPLYLYIILIKELNDGVSFIKDQNLKSSAQTLKH